MEGLISEVVWFVQNSFESLDKALKDALVDELVLHKAYVDATQRIKKTRRRSRSLVIPVLHTSRCSSARYGREPVPFPCPIGQIQELWNG